MCSAMSEQENYTCSTHVLHTHIHTHTHTHTRRVSGTYLMWLLIVMWTVMGHCTTLTHSIHRRTPPHPHTRHTQTHKHNDAHTHNTLHRDAKNKGGNCFTVIQKKDYILLACCVNYTVFVGRQGIFDGNSPEAKEKHASTQTTRKICGVPPPSL
jgi:hypothetical protein